MSSLDPGFQSYFDRQSASQAPRPAPGSIPPATLRLGYCAQRQALNRQAPPDVAVLDLDVIGGEGGLLPARLYDGATDGGSSGLLVYFHGGGFVIGDLESHDGHCRRLAFGAGCKVLAIDYRLAPEYPFPAAHDDALSATRWALANAQDLGVDPNRIAVGGDSAGGNLAASVAIDLATASRRPIFQLLLYPVLWPEQATESRRLLDGPVLTRASLAWFEQCLAANDHPQFQRARMGGADLKGVAPALIVTAGFDPLKDEGRDYAHRLRDAGVPVRHIEYSTLPHDFYVMADVSPAVASAVAETTNILAAALDGKSF